MVKKLPRALSSNARPKSSLSVGSRDWQTVTHERNFTGTLRNAESFVTRKLDTLGFNNKKKVKHLDGREEDDIRSHLSEETQKVMASIKKIDRRIKKTEVLLSTRDESVRADAQARLVKLNSLRNRQIQVLQEANKVKSQADKRILNRFAIKQALEAGEMVRLENKLVTSKRVAKEIEAEKAKQSVDIAENPQDIWSDEERARIEAEFNDSMGE